MTPKSRNAAIYVRQSEDVPEGIERGLTGARRLVADRGWTLVGEFSDNATSASKERGAHTDWARMIALIRAGEIDAVVGIDMDRLLRRIEDVLTLVNAGVVITTLDGDLDTTTAEGYRRAVDQANAARFEAKRKGERQQRANTAARALGKVAPGRRCYGYTTTKNRAADVIREEAEVVARAFEHIDAGRSLRSFVAALVSEDVPVTTGIGWRVGRIRDMLSNRRYRGDFVGIPAIVDTALFDRVQGILADPARKTTTGPAPQHLLSGLATCGVCGRTLNVRGRSRATESRPANPGGYGCAEGHVYLRHAEKLEELALPVLREAMGKGEPAPAMTAPGLARLREQQSELAGKIERASDLYTESGEAGDRARVTKLRGEARDLQERIDALSTPEDDPLSTAARDLYRFMAEWRENLATDWSAVYPALEALQAWEATFAALDIEERRALARRHLSVALNRSGVEPRVNISSR